MTADDWIAEDDTCPCPSCGATDHAPEDECPRDIDAPELCQHGREAGLYCPACEAAGYEALAQVFASLLTRVSMTEDETLGAALAARWERQ